MSYDVNVRKLSRPTPAVAAQVAARWPGVAIGADEVTIHGLPWATFERDGAVLRLNGGNRAGAVLAWIGWAIAAVEPGAAAFDPQEGKPIRAEPIPFAEVERLTREAQAEADADASATEPYAGPDPGGDSEGHLILEWLVANQLIEGGPFPKDLVDAVTAIVEADKGVGAKLEKLLLAADSVEELYAGPDDLKKIVKSGVWVPARR